MRIDGTRTHEWRDPMPLTSAAKLDAHVPARDAQRRAATGCPEREPVAILPQFGRIARSRAGYAVAAICAMKHLKLTQRSADPSPGADSSAFIKFAFLLFQPSLGASESTSHK